ncbi:MAG: phage integrase SAM-like domain-containing protein [Tannerella sp.]|nr:phage integrase SAM-like domain-containing protein [Tannerella sp.]
MSNRKKQPKVKEPVKVRFRERANGNKSVYLDIYNDGERRCEFLKHLYIKPERTQADKEDNKETMRIANAVKAQRILELQNETHGFSTTSGRSKINLLDYIQNFAEKKSENAGGRNRGGNYKSFMALRYHLVQYKGNNITFKQVNKDFCAGFIEYMKTAKQNPETSRIKYSRNSLCENTQYTYMIKFATVLNAAVLDGIINNNPIKQIKPENRPKKQTTEIEYLTIDEVKKLVETPCL